MNQYQARQISNGRVVGTAKFESFDDKSARREAEDGINILAGQWVELKLLPPEEGEE